MQCEISASIDAVFPLRIIKKASNSSHETQVFSRKKQTCREMIITSDAAIYEISSFCNKFYLKPSILQCDAVLHWLSQLLALLFSPHAVTVRAIPACCKNSFLRVFFSASQHQRIIYLYFYYQFVYAMFWFCCCESWVPFAGCQ